MSDTTTTPTAMSTTTTTTFYLIRHGSHDWLQRGVPGRIKGLNLNDRGLEEASELVNRLAGVSLHALYCSPLERTRQTAAPLAAHLNLPVISCQEALEIDYGEWTGLEYSELNNRAGWSEWNSFRNQTTPPGGESMLAVQARVIGLLKQLVTRHPGEDVPIITHGDVIKAVLLFCCGMPLDMIFRLEVSPASISIVEISSYGVKILKINDTGRLSGQAGAC